MVKPVNNGWREEVLSQLDAAQDEYALLGPGNSHYPSAAVRMIAFVSDVDWLLSLELLAWGRREGQFVRLLQFFGSTVEEPGEFSSAEPVHGSPESPLFVDGKLQADLYDLTISMDGSLRHLTFTPTDYASAGIEVEEMAPELALLRLLANRYPEQLMLDADAVLTECDRKGYHHLFTLDDWRHPDPAEDELPGELPCFQGIAESIASGQVRELSACSDEANTHWSNWTMYE